MSWEDMPGTAERSPRPTCHSFSLLSSEYSRRIDCGPLHMQAFKVCSGPANTLHQKPSVTLSFHLYFFRLHFCTKTARQHDIARNVVEEKQTCCFYLILTSALGLASRW